MDRETLRAAALAVLLIPAIVVQVARAEESPPDTTGAPALPPGLSPASREPALPPGLGPSPTEAAEPSLPPGLGPSDARSDEPALPAGLFGAADTAKTAPHATLSWRQRLPVELTGFVDARTGALLADNAHEDRWSLGEGRVQVEAEKAWETTTLRLTADLLYDPAYGEYDIELEEGRGVLDLREASLALTPTDFADVKVGRQIATWGTGDLLFINDMFPKDWQAFFIGRDDEYLKAPSDAARVSLYSSLANADFVYSPRFDADRFIDGSRISYYSGTTGGIAGQDQVIGADRPDSWFGDGELAWRASRTVRGHEVAAYGYYGYWKSPGGVDAASGSATFPALFVHGASARGNLGRGIGNLEVGLYSSRDDDDGDDPTVRNGELRLLAGYEQEVAKSLTLGIQYYLERLLDHAGHTASLPAGAPEPDENRQLITARLTKLLMNQNLRTGVFVYWSPTDQDAYLRPSLHYKLTDAWSVVAGANVFVGKDDHTFFGQFADNTNAYAAARWSY